MPMSVIGQWSDDDQPQRSALSATTPKNGPHRLITQLVSTTGSKYRGALPRNGVILAHLFWSAQVFTVGRSSASTGWRFRQSRQMNVFTSSSDQDGTFGQSAKDREIAIAGIDNHPQDALGEIGHGIQPRADLLNQSRSLSTEALLPAHLVILFPFRIGRRRARFLGIGVVGVRNGGFAGFFFFGFG